MASMLILVCQSKYPRQDSNISQKALKNEGAGGATAQNTAHSAHETALRAWLDGCPVKLSDDAKRSILAIVGGKV
jgi:hypothetical protein